MFCPNCGAQNADNVAFCASCGANMGAQQPVYQAPVQPMYQAPVQPVYQQPIQQSVPGKGMGITGMVLGIVALVLFCMWYVSIPSAIVGAILSGVALKKAQEVGKKNGMATAGLVCSCIALGIAILFVLAVASCAADIVDAFDYGYYY